VRFRAQLPLADPSLPGPWQVDHLRGARKVQQLPLALSRVLLAVGARLTGRPFGGLGPLQALRATCPRQRGRVGACLPCCVPIPKW
jgi:hypothetical protein